MSLRPINRAIARTVARTVVSGAISPTITSASSFNAAENQTAVGTVTATGTAPITFSISGTDSALFAINSSSGVLTFLLAPDFETPGDAGGNNVYNLTATATNAGGATNQTISVTVTDVLEVPAGFIGWWKKGTQVEAGTGVSQWPDQHGTPHHLAQGTDANRPTKNGDGSATWNGTSDSLVTGAWARAQPFTFYARLKVATHAVNDCIANFNEGAGNLILRQVGTSPDICIATGASVAINSNLTLGGAYKNLAVVINGASSVIHIDGTTATTGDAGATALSALRIGSQLAGFFFSDITAQEMLMYPAAHDATDRQAVFDYLVTL